MGKGIDAKPPLRALLAGLFDYAGMFPPARLPLEEAAANYCRYRQGDDAWMLARFVCPADRVAELEAWKNANEPSGPPLPLTVLMGDARSARETLAALAESPAVAVEALEFRVEETAIAEAGAAIVEASFSPATSWFELASPTEVNIRDLAAEIAAAGGGPASGLKLRMGGVVADAFPTPEAVATAIAVCAKAGIPMKATAGLHHPLPRRDEAIGARMHGFLNLALAVALFRHHGADAESIVELLRESDPAAFALGDEGISWRDRRLTTEQIERSRCEAFTTIGSCSFDEPRDDLRSLLPP